LAGLAVSKSADNKGPMEAYFAKGVTIC